MKFALLLAGAVMLAGPRALAVPPAEVFASLPAISNVHLSPDGQYFSAIEPVDGRPTVVVFKLGDPNTKPIIFADPGSFATDSIWVNNDRLLCLVYGNVKDDQNSAQKYYQRSRTISVSISGKDPVVLMKKSKIYAYNSSTTDIIGLNSDNPNIVYVVAGEWVETSAYTTLNMDNQAAINNLYSVNVETGDVDILEKGNKDTITWYMDGHGHPVARVDRKDLTYSLFVYDHGAERLAKTFDGSHGEDSGFVGLSADGSSLVGAYYRRSDTIGVFPFPLSGSDFGAPLFSNPAYDMDSTIADEWTGRIIGVRYDGDKPEAYYFDPARQKLQHQLELALPGQSVSIESVDAKGVNVLVASEDSQHPRTYWLYNSVTHHLDALATQYPQLQPTDLGEMKPYPYKSRDGLDIRAYLTLPPGKIAKNLPVVIFPHGGPAARDAMGFDWWTQFMASRGYAVLQPNFRGSSGYGYKFEHAGDGEWGRKMQDDISDGVKKLIADGIADPKRICIVGASYGGYAALVGATFTPDLYACAVSYAGISNVSNIMGDIYREEGAKSGDVALMRRRLGAAADSRKAADDVSPAAHADQVRAPILLLHSAKDVTVPLDESTLEQSVLQKTGKNVQLIVIDGDDHYMNLATTRARVLKEIETFLEAHIGH